jgi:hypothetical protein
MILWAGRSDLKLPTPRAQDGSYGPIEGDLFSTTWILRACPTLLESVGSVRILEALNSYKIIYTVGISGDPLTSENSAG